MKNWDDDGRFMREVGPWAKDKYHFLGRYLDAFTTAMRNRYRLHYIDLFCGSGLARIKGTGEVVAGSPLIAANLRFPFHHLHLCDAAPSNIRALKERLAEHDLLNPPIVLEADANEAIGELLSGAGEYQSLSVAFVDPFGLHLDFETIRTLAQSARADLIILFADSMDALRNLKLYWDDPEQASNLDRWMGTNEWRGALEGLGPEERGRTLRKFYEDRLSSELGYEHFEQVFIENSRRREIYSLIFASKHERGAQLWRGIAEKGPGGQRTFGFGPS